MTTKAQINRLRKMVRESNINQHDRMRIEAVIMEYGLLVPFIAKAAPLLQGASEQVGTILNPPKPLYGGNSNHHISCRCRECS